MRSPTTNYVAGHVQARNEYEIMSTKNGGHDQNMAVQTGADFYTNPLMERIWNKDGT
jgi:hypothetical protein